MTEFCKYPVSFTIEAHGIVSLLELSWLTFVLPDGCRQRNKPAAFLLKQR